MLCIEDNQESIGEKQRAPPHSAIIDESRTALLMLFEHHLKNTDTFILLNRQTP